MRTSVPILFALLACACSSGANKGASVAVSNLTVGLMRQDRNGEWTVYAPGYEFPNELLMCKAKFNKPTDMVTADQIEKNNTADATFAIPLRGREGHYSQSAHVFRNPDDAPTPWSAEISCKHNDIEVIRFTFTALYEA
jgi:hypothetical protein